MVTAFQLAQFCPMQVILLPSLLAGISAMDLMARRIFVAGSWRDRILQVYFWKQHYQIWSVTLGMYHTVENMKYMEMEFLRLVDLDPTVMQLVEDTHII